MTLEAFLGFLAELLKFGVTFYLVVLALGLVAVAILSFVGRRNWIKVKAHSDARRREMDERWRGKR